MATDDVTMNPADETVIDPPAPKLARLSKCPFSHSSKPLQNTNTSIDNSVIGELDVKQNSSPLNNSKDLDDSFNGETRESGNSEADYGPSNDDLRQFDVLDDLGHHSDQDGTDCDSDSNDSMDSEVPDEEIEAMLDEGLPEEFRAKRKERGDCMPYEEKEKLVLDEIGHNHFDVLPEGWVQVTHNSGMPLYLHKQSRVCTLAKPYFLGPGSVRKHEVPVSAVPCLQYRRALQEEVEEKQKLKEKEPTTGTDACNLPSAKIETIQENLANHSLDSERLRNYCQELFRFKTIKVMRFQ